MTIARQSGSVEICSLSFVLLLPLNMLLISGATGDSQPAEDSALQERCPGK